MTVEIVFFLNPRRSLPVPNVSPVACPPGRSLGEGWSPITLFIQSARNHPSPSVLPDHDLRPEKRQPPFPARRSIVRGRLNCCLRPSHFGRGKRDQKTTRPDRPVERNSSGRPIHHSNRCRRRQSDRNRESHRQRRHDLLHRNKRHRRPMEKNLHHRGRRPHESRTRQRPQQTQTQTPLRIVCAFGGSLPAVPRISVPAPNKKAAEAFPPRRPF